MLDIPELEEFDKVISSHSWLDETTGELMAWSRGEYDDFRRQHHERKLPTSTDILRYFGYSLDRFGWMQVMSNRFDFATPDRKGDSFEWGRHKRTNRIYDEINADDEEVEGSPLDIEDKSIVGWEDQVHAIVDNKLGPEATEELIDLMLGRPVFS